MSRWKKEFSILLFIVLGLAMLQSFTLQVGGGFFVQKTERTRVIKKDFDSKQAIVVGHEHGPLLLKKSADGKTHMEAEMLVTGTDEESIEELLKRFEVDVIEDGGNLDLKTNLGIANWTKINNKATVKFCDGEKIKGISDFKVTMTLYVADPKQLKLSNKYDKIELPDGFAGDLSVNLYSGDLLAGNLGGQVELDLKYSKAKLGALGKCKWAVYDSEVSAGTVESAQVSSKYSEFRLGNVSGDLTLETYDDDWRLGNVAGNLRLNDKYSTFKFGDVGTADIVIYDGEIDAENVGGLSIGDTKYTEYKITAVGSLKLGEVFDDNFKIGSLEAAEIRSSKYTEYQVEKLGKSFNIGQSYDDAVHLVQVATGFSLIQLDGKYTELEMAVAAGAQFEFSVDQQYGKVSYPESKVETRKYIEKNNRLELVANAGGGQSGSSANAVKITGYDNQITWR